MGFSRFVVAILCSVALTFLELNIFYEWNPLAGQLAFEPSAQEPHDAVLLIYGIGLLGVWVVKSVASQVMLGACAVAGLLMMKFAGAGTLPFNF